MARLAHLAHRGPAVTRPRCQGPPPEYWDIGDDGNRLALMLCDVCPRRRGTECDAGLADPNPHGVIRAGVPYSEAGNAISICIICGYPNLGFRDGIIGKGCPRCAPPPLERFRGDITRMVARGDSYAAVGRLIGAERTSIRDACKRWGVTRPTTDTDKMAA